MSSPKLTKFLALFDLHIGFERGLERGKWVVRKTYNEKAIRAVMKFAEDFRPDVLVLGGDALNCGPISHWHKGKPILDEGFKIKKEMDILDDLVLRPLDKVGRKIWLFGNHENWLLDHVAENPGLEGLIEPDKYLRLEKRGYEIYSQGEVASIGKLHFTHGDTIMGKGSSQNPAKKLVNAYRRNIRCGHLHSYSAAIDQTAVDAKDFHSGIVVPSLSTRNPTFVHNCPNQFMQGFLFGYSWSDGAFSDYVVIINKNEFTVNGKRYKS